jgi:hypothetical protein
MLKAAHGVSSSGICSIFFTNSRLSLSLETAVISFNRLPSDLLASFPIGIKRWKAGLQWFLTIF